MLVNNKKKKIYNKHIIYSNLKRDYLLSNYINYILIKNIEKDRWEHYKLVILNNSYKVILILRIYKEEKLYSIK